MGWAIQSLGGQSGHGCSVERSVMMASTAAARLSELGEGDPMSAAAR
jgi:hypothetical protein